MFEFLNFSFPEFPQFLSSLLLLFLFLGLELFHSFPSTICFFLYFFKRFIFKREIYSWVIIVCVFLALKDLFIFFKDLHHLHIVDFKVFFLCFDCAGISRAWCGAIAGLSWRHIVLCVSDSVFAFASRHLGLG